MWTLEWLSILIIVIVARRLHDSPHPIARFNQHIVLYKLFPEHQSKYGVGCPVNTKVVLDDVVSEEEDSTLAEPGHPKGIRDEDGRHNLPIESTHGNQQTHDASMANLRDLPMAQTRDIGNDHMDLNDPSTIPLDDNLTTVQSGEKRKEPSDGTDASTMPPDDNLTTTQIEEKRKEPSDNPDTSDLGVDEDEISSARGPSMELDVRYLHHNCAGILNAHP